MKYLILLALFPVYAGSQSITVEGITNAIHIDQIGRDGTVITCVKMPKTQDHVQNYETPMKCAKVRKGLFFDCIGTTQRVLICKEVVGI